MLFLLYLVLSTLTLTIILFCLEASMSSSDVVAFLSGLLLGGDTKARNWFSSFVRIGQKVWKHSLELFSFLTTSFSDKLQLVNQSTFNTSPTRQSCLP